MCTSRRLSPANNAQAGQRRVTRCPLRGALGAAEGVVHREQPARWRRRARRCSRRWAAAMGVLARAAGLAATPFGLAPWVAPRRPCPRPRARNRPSTSRSSSRDGAARVTTIQRRRTTGAPIRATRSALRGSVSCTAPRQIAQRAKSSDPRRLRSSTSRRQPGATSTSPWTGPRTTSLPSPSISSTRPARCCRMLRARSERPVSAPSRAPSPPSSCWTR
mmetsp:Transcript_2511/g.8586  ORF Transcript_2511/g.8586 Transcript_2511/m.8586 type:complete len:219 (-) Transcript_2511:862-1518(-)